jgi:hypothetical protein
MQLEKTSNKIEQIVRFFRNGYRQLLLKQHLTEMKLGFFEISEALSTSAMNQGNNRDNNP